MEDRDRRRIVERSEEAANLDLADLSVGQTFSLTHTFDADAVDRFAELCGDFSPLHVDDAYAAETEFGGRVVHGMLLASLFSTLVGMRIPGRRALYLGQELNFRRPVRVGETVTATGKVASVSPALGLVQLTTSVLKADGSIAVTGAGKVRVRGSGTQASSRDVPTLTAAPGQKAALVTGASRGLGAAIARRLAEEGYAVGVNYRSSEAAARQVAADIVSAGGAAIPLCADVRDEDAAASMVATLVDRFSRLDLLVNNASLPYELRNVHQVAWPDVAAHLEGSVRGPLALARAAYPHLRASAGAIVNILSQVVEAQPPPQMLDYVVGKFGLLGLTRSLAVEWAADGIRVNGVAPSLLETDMTGHFADRVFKLEASRTPLRRLATVDDVAGAVSYLGGADASFLTGVVLTVAGGRVMK
jgi:3-oxoacyl-[acyl-carrier protein] reductase